MQDSHTRPLPCLCMHAAAVLMLAAEAQPPPSLPQRSKLKVANEVSALVGVQRSTVRCALVLIIGTACARQLA